MQGQRSSAIGSLPETLGFDHGSTSSDDSMDQQICWTNMQTSTSDPSSPYLNYLSQGQNLSGWNVGEPSSSGTNGVGPVLEERQYEPANSTLSLNNVIVSNASGQLSSPSLFVQSSSNSISQNLNMNEGIERCGGDDCQIMDYSNNAYKFGIGPFGISENMSENTQIPSASSSSEPFGLPSGSGGYLVEENDGSPGCSLEGRRRLSCKRKAFEGNNTGQSSISGSSSYFQPADRSTVWHGYSVGNSLSVPTPAENILHASPSEQVNVRLGLGAGGGATSGNPLALNVSGNAESSQRNYRVRINNPSRQQDSVPINIFSTGSTAVHSNVFSQNQSSRLLPLTNPLDMSSPSSAADGTNLRRTPQSSRWSGGSSSRAGHSSSSGERDALLHEESNSMSMPRNISEHPMFIPANEMRNSAQNATNWSLTGGNITIPGNAASTSRTGSSSGVHPLSGPNWVPHRNPPRYPRRLSDLVRRSLLSSAGSTSGGQSSSNNTPVSLGPSSQEIALSSGAGNPGDHLSHARSAISLERQLDGAFGISYSLRTVAAASEGRSRLVSEIRNVLDLMRRGEGLRFEDVMILDQSVFFGMADLHDRHRDMRLDVDNMSYEELLALEERIGNVNTGLNEETILSRLKQRKYFSIAMGAQLEVEPCCICQEEYNDGEDIGTVECGHEFHSECVKQWLMHKNLCPICKTTALNK
ncbi:RING-type E3 ubiquitin transferase [Sarracenia purpurea var. burkii]